MFELSIFWILVYFTVFLQFLSCLWNFTFMGQMGSRHSYSSARVCSMQFSASHTICKSLQHNRCFKKNLCHRKSRRFFPKISPVRSKTFFSHKPWLGWFFQIGIFCVLLLWLLVFSGMSHFSFNISILLVMSLLLLTFNGTISNWHACMYAGRYLLWRRSTLN